MERALNICIRTASGQSIEEDDDFMKELKILERQKKQDLATEQSRTRFSEEEVWNVLEFVFFPMVEEFDKAVKAVNDVFCFSQSLKGNYLSKKQDYKDGLQVNDIQRADSGLMTNANISDLEADGCKYIIGGRIKNET